MQHPDRARKSGKGWVFWVLVVGVPVAVVLYAVGIVAVGVLFNYTTKTLPVSDREWAVVVDAHDLAAWVEGMPVSSKYGQLKKVRYFDFSHEVDYQYDDPEYGVSITSTLNIERKVSDAFATYVPLWTATKAGFSFGTEADITVEEHEDFYHWGDQSRFAILYADGAPFGNLFVARADKRVVFLILAGVFFDDPTHWQSFITPTLDAAASYTPDK